MKVFDNYSQYYDLLYTDKPYREEVQFLLDCLSNHHELPKDGLNFLEFGCGTGGHSRILAELGHKVHGIDLSETMVDMAKKNQEAMPLEHQAHLQYEVGNISQSGKIGNFDAVISLFHVINYQTTHEALKNTFESANQNLEKGGFFFFDFWYGPAVLNDLPKIKTKDYENSRLRVTRKTSPVIKPNENVVCVHFDMTVLDRESGEVHSFSEQHEMRYSFLPELILYANNAGFELVKMGKWMSEEELDLSTWNGFALWKKI